MKPLLILCILSLILVSHCENIPIIGGKKKSSALKNFNERTLLVCWIGRYTIIKETKIIDNKDGTIALADVTTQVTDYCFLPLGKTQSINAKYYIKKCIQGQVYRQAQNDCKGTGTAANYYGAQKYQWCSTNDRSCEKLDSSGNYLIDDTKSPAALACKNDKTIGITWSLVPGVNSSEKFQFFQRPEEIPLGSNDFFWGDKAFDSSTALVAFMDPSKTFQKANKSDFNYVLCAGYPNGVL